MSDSLYLQPKTKNLKISARYAFGLIIAKYNGTLATNSQQDINIQPMGEFEKESFRTLEPN
jgi:hypothetical protein